MILPPYNRGGWHMLVLDPTGYRVRNPGTDYLISNCWSAGYHKLSSHSNKRLQLHPLLLITTKDLTVRCCC